MLDDSPNSPKFSPPKYLAERYTHQLDSQQQTDDYPALLDPVECSHPAGDDEDGQ